MKYGFVLSKGTPADALRLAIEAEDAGWDGVFTWDTISTIAWSLETVPSRYLDMPKHATIQPDYRR